MLNGSLKYQHGAKTMQHERFKYQNVANTRLFPWANTMYHERLKYQKVTNTIQNGRLKCQTCSKYRAKWKVNMPKCSKYHAKCQVLVPNCCKYMANGTSKHIPQKKHFSPYFKHWPRTAKYVQISRRSV